MDHSLRYLLFNQLGTIRDSGYAVAGVSSTGSEIEHLERAGIDHTAVTISRRISPIADLGSFANLVRVFRKKKFTIVHTHTPKVGLLGQIAAWGASVPVIVNTIHGFYLHDAMPKWKQQLICRLEWFAARFSDAVLFQNSEDMQRASEQRIVPQGKQHWIGNGIDLDRFDATKVDQGTIEKLFRDLGLQPDIPVVGFVGRVVREKGIGELLAACRALKQQGLEFQLLIVGPLNNERGDAISKELVAEVGLGDCCVMAGKRDDVPELISLMDVLALPSYREGFPRAPMEAAAMGVPCVATNIRGCRQAVEDGRTGLLVPAKSTDALADALQVLLKHTERRQVMGDAARQKALREFDERDVFQRVLAVYDQLLRAKGMTPPTGDGQGNPLAGAF